MFESSEERRDSGGVRSPEDARSSKSSKLSSLRMSSSSNEIKSRHCRLLLKEVALSEKRVRSVTNSFSESRSEKESNVGRPVSVVPFDELKALERKDSCLIKVMSPPRISLCSSSSPEHKVGKVGKSGVTDELTGLSESTSKLRGSQKLNCVSEDTDCGTGDGEGESDGQALMDRRSEAWLTGADGGLINTISGVTTLAPGILRAPLQNQRQCKATLG